jgi:UDP-glucose 6-dehydrogenase
MAYKIGVIGTGYVGLVSGTCFAAQAILLLRGYRSGKS